MADIFDPDEFTRQDAYSKYGIRLDANYEPDPYYQLEQNITGKEPEVAFRETPLYDQQIENIQKSLPKTLYSLLKGMVQGEVGIGGDIEQLLKSANIAGQAYFGDEKNAEEYEAMIQSLEQTVFPTTADVKSSLETVVPPVEGFEASEKIGEIISPGATILAGMKLLKALFKPNKGAALAVTTKEGLNNDNRQ